VGIALSTINTEMQTWDRKIVETKLQALFSQVLLAGTPEVETDLFETGILDSQRFVELLLQIETQFNSHIDLEHFEIENFRCIAMIATLILKCSQHTAKSDQPQTPVVTNSR
jgi:acyl carrier protein